MTVHITHHLEQGVKPDWCEKCSKFQPHLKEPCMMLFFDPIAYEEYLNGN